MAFAEGALLAASWIRDKVGTYEFSEILFGKS
jgi:dihydrodipicolinate reductase